METAVRIWGDSVIHYNPDPSPTTWAPDVWGDWPAISATVDDGLGDSVQYYVAMTCANAATAIPCRMLTGYPGFSRTAVGIAQEATPDVYDAYVESQDSFTAAIADFVTLFTDATDCVVLDNQTNADDERGVTQVGMALRATDASATSIYIVIGGSTLPNKVISSDPEITLFGFFADSAQSELTGGSGGIPGLDRIADVLEEWSLQDVSLSINHGQAIWSAKGKITTG